MDRGISRPDRILMINVGSSSLKAVLYRVGPTESVEIRATAERVGSANSSLQVTDGRDIRLSQMRTRSETTPPHSRRSWRGYKVWDS